MKIRSIFSLLLCFAILLSFVSCKSDDVTETTTQNNRNDEVVVITEEMDVSQVADYEAKPVQNSQVGIIVDSWLKIISIGERDGKLSVFARNIADVDIQYAVLNVISGDKVLTFSMSTILAGSNIVLTCDTPVNFDENARYYGWEINDKIVFENELSLYPEMFEISGDDGSVFVKNISKKNIKGDIYIYYKTVSEGVFAEGTTYRVCVNGLKNGESLRVVAEHFKKDSSKVMFVTYVQ